MDLAVGRGRYTETRRSRVICLCFYLFYIKFTKTEKCKLKKRSLNLSEDGANVQVCESRDSTRDVGGVASWASYLYFDDAFQDVVEQDDKSFTSGGPSNATFKLLETFTFIETHSFASIFSICSAARTNPV